MSVEASRWFEFARQDLRLAELALAEGIWSQACFHAQLGAEKTLKGILTSRGMIPPRTHKLADLLALIGDGVFPRMVESLFALDRFLPSNQIPRYASRIYRGRFSGRGGG